MTMKKIIIAAAALVLIIGGVFLFKKGKKAPAFRELAPERGTIAVEFRETGTVSPRNRLEIKPPISGRVEEVNVVEGQMVKKGEIIAWLSSSERAALLDAARSKGVEEMNKWEDIYRQTPIIAPLDGFIIARSKEPGQTVGVSDVLLVMADELIIEASVDETDLRYIKTGQKVKVSLDAYPDQEFGGVVEHIAYESAVINNVTVYTVKIRPRETPENFRAGMTATIDVEANRKENALLLPYEAVIERNNEKSVMIKWGRKKGFEMRRVEAGINNGKQVEIISGIADGEIVLVRSGSNPEKKNERRRVGGLPGMGGRR